MGSSGLVESGSGRARGRSSRARGPGPRGHDDSPWGSGPGRDGGGRPKARPFRLDPSDVRGVQDRARSASRVRSTSPRPGSQASARSHEAPAPALMRWPDAGVVASSTSTRRCNSFYNNSLKLKLSSLPLIVSLLRNRMSAGFEDRVWTSQDRGPQRLPSADQRLRGTIVATAVVATRRSRDGQRRARVAGGQRQNRATPRPRHRSPCRGNAMFFDPMYFLFILPGLGLSLWASARVKRTFNRYAKV